MCDMHSNTYSTVNMYALSHTHRVQRQVRHMRSGESAHYETERQKGEKYTKKRKKKQQVGPTPTQH